MGPHKKWSVAVCMYDREADWSTHYYTACRLPSRGCSLNVYTYIHSWFSCGRNCDAFYLFMTFFVCCRFRTEARAAGYPKSHMMTREEREEAELAEMKKVTRRFQEGGGGGVCVFVVSFFCCPGSLCFRYLLCLANISHRNTDLAHEGGCV